MIDPCEVLPVLALALAIVLLPLVADRPPQRSTTHQLANHRCSQAAGASDIDGG